MSNETFAKNLMRWYRKHGRHHLPWRHTKDPYHILVSEIMLQQTQVERVMPKYRAFLKKFPTLQKLAHASAASVLRTWHGMGYNRRALYLKRIAQICVRDFEGRVPDTYEALRKLPGVGDYTARAVLSFAFGEHIALADTNIRRIFSRVYFGKNPSAVSEKKLAAVVAREMPHYHTTVYDSESHSKRGKCAVESHPNTALYQGALMDLGATVCRAKPLCSVCPLQKICKAAPKVLARGPQALQGRVVRHPQSKFEGSDRQMRGNVVETLRRNAPQPPLTLRGGVGELKIAHQRMKKILNSLLRDGLIMKKGSMFMLPR